MTWKDLAKSYPEFVQWIVQKFGPLPEGEISADDYNRYADAWNRAGK